MTRLTLYGGASEIGGNKILVEDKDTKIFFDFGKSVSAERAYFGEGIAPRRINGVGDYLEFGLLPRLQGLYDRSQLNFTWMPYKPPEFQAAIISHSHADHAGHVGLLDRNIPVYCGDTTKTILGALQESTDPKRGVKLLGLPSFKPFRTGEKIRVGSIEVEPVHVDHSVPGAYGFIIHTLSGTIVYTGDLRSHGPVPELTEDFLNRASRAQPDILLCEGTCVGAENGSILASEDAVERKAKAVISRTQGFVAASFNIRETDRFNTLHKVAAATNRRLALPMRTAHLLMHLQKDIHLKLPDTASDENILIYKKEVPKDRATGQEKRYDWEREVLRRYPNEKFVGHRFVHDNPSNVILVMEPHEIGELVDVRPDAGGIYIHSRSEVFSEEEEVGEGVLGNWLSHFGMKLRHIHTSGHAHPEGIRTIIQRINPKRLIPIHTACPNMFSQLAKKTRTKVLQLKKAQPLQLT